MNENYWIYLSSLGKSWHIVNGFESGHGGVAEPLKSHAE